MSLAETSEWVPPAIPDLRLVERNGQWLCLNPSVPGWVITTRAGTLLLQLADGRRSVQEIGDLLRAGGLDVEQRDVAAFFSDGIGRVPMRVA